MKKLFTVVCAMFVFAIVTNAQTTEAKSTETKVPTKEEKQKMKEKQEADLAAAFKEIGLTDEQVQQVKAVMDATNQKNKELRMDATLSDDDKKAKMKVNNDEKNEKIKSIMGEEKYKQFNAIKKRQKAESTPQVQAAGN
jgi:Spy/CpxP family protein refolding chaperone